MSGTAHAYSARPFYTRIALLGIGMYVAIEIVILATTLAFLPRSDLWYPLLVGGLALAGGVAIYFWHPWGLIIGLLGGPVSITFSLDSIGTNLSSPDSFFDFAYRPVIWSGGTVLVLGGSSAGLVQHFRGRTGVNGPTPVARTARGLVALIAVISVVSAAVTVAGIDRVSAGERANAIVVTASGWKFSPRTITVESRGPAKLLLENNDANIHTFTIDAVSLDSRLGPFGDTLIVFPSPPPGRYEFRCRILGHESMRGTLIVE